MELVFVRKLGDGYGRTQSAPARSKPRLIKRAACMVMDEMSMTQPNQTSQGDNGEDREQVQI